MVSFFRRALNAFLPDKSERRLEFTGDTYFDHHSAVFSTTANVSEAHIKDLFLKRKTDTAVKIVNSGAITVTERIVIVDKSTLTEFIKREKEALISIHFAVKNKGNLNIVNTVYLILSDVEAFLKSGLLELLSDGITWESPVFIKKNKGSITKKVEVVAQIGEEEVKQLDKKLAFSFTFTVSDKNIIKKLSIKNVDMECFKEALCTLSV